MSDEQNVLIVGTDRYGRTWRVKDWDDQFAVYYDKAEERHTLYDSRDQWSDPPRVLLGIAEAREREHT